MFKVYVSKERNGGFRVCCQYLPGMDEMWETFNHYYLFRSKIEADHYAEKIRRAGFDALNLEASWSWAPSDCSPLAIKQTNPTVKMMTVPQ